MFFGNGYGRQSTLRKSQCRDDSSYLSFNRMGIVTESFQILYKSLLPSSFAVVDASCRRSTNQRPPSWRLGAAGAHVQRLARNKPEFHGSHSPVSVSFLSRKGSRQTFPCSSPIWPVVGLAQPGATTGRRDDRGRACAQLGSQDRRRPCRRCSGSTHTRRRRRSRGVPSLRWVRIYQRQPMEPPGGCGETGRRPGASRRGVSRFETPALA